MDHCTEGTTQMKPHLAMSKVWGLSSDIPECEEQSTSRRDPNLRLFVNRSMSLETIRYYGFDMDYTLAEYCTPYMEAETAKYAFEKLVELGYPKELKETKFLPDFAVRGLIFDRKLGTFLKLDLHGLVLTACKGTRKFTRAEIREEYPTKFCKLFEKMENGENRFLQLFDTLFDTPKIFVTSIVIDWLEKSPQYTKSADGYFDRSTNLEITYVTVWSDMRHVFEMIHQRGPLHKNIMSHPELFINRNPLLPAFLNYLRENDKKVFMLTNSPYTFTDTVMRYLLNTESEGKKWQDYFDVVVVKACKPAFFQQGTPLRLINQETGAANIGLYRNSTMVKGEIYSGGNCDLFCQMTGAEGPDILYFGDHIYGDVVRSKKTNGWKTFLVVPELRHELDVWTSENVLFEEHHNLEKKLGELQAQACPDNNAIRKLDQQRKMIVDQIDAKYNPYFGSMFRKGGRLSSFANQMDRYADVYSSTTTNLLNYSLKHQFWSPPKLLPHEATVAQDHDVADQ